MTQDEGPSVTGVTFIGKFQQLEITSNFLSSGCHIPAGRLPMAKCKIDSLQRILQLRKIPCKNE